MKKVINIPRIAAEKFSFLPKNAIWISIGEPEKTFIRINNEFLDQIPNLKIELWDLDEPCEFEDEILLPPSREEAQKIVNFILEHKDKNVLVNCAAGVSRSGAVARFCEECLGYEWLEDGKRCALPNYTLFKRMRECYELKTSQ